jgi:hypothetical protein
MDIFLKKIYNWLKRISSEKSNSKPHSLDGYSQPQPSISAGQDVEKLEMEPSYTARNVKCL